MKLTVVIFLLIIALISCRENKQEDSPIAREILNSEKGIEQNLNAYCFF